MNIKKEEITIKNSKFIAIKVDITSIEDAKEIIKKTKKEHNRASHVIYVANFENKFLKSDDKEPKNIATLPIIKMLELKKIKNILIIVIRYKKGPKLGASLLMRSYLNAVKEVI